jgi:hypothetical protein
MIMLIRVPLKGDLSNKKESERAKFFSDVPSIWRGEGNARLIVYYCPVHGGIVHKFSTSMYCCAPRTIKDEFYTIKDIVVPYHISSTTASDRAVKSKCNVFTYSVGSSRIPISSTRHSIEVSTPHSSSCKILKTYCGKSFSSAYNSRTLSKTNSTTHIYSIISSCKVVYGVSRYSD